MLIFGIQAVLQNLEDELLRIISHDINETRKENLESRAEQAVKNTDKGGKHLIKITVSNGTVNTV